MARFGTSPNTASCQFYITLGPKPNLDNQYAVFGGVLSGMDVVNSIAKGDHIKSITVQEQQ
jgi:cyclophilin family peptidyl-prolyl cis-trans isomerase